LLAERVRQTLMARSIGRAAEALEAIGTADGDLEEAAMMPIRIPRGSTVPAIAKASP
jgi:hypothetical protein